MAICARCGKDSPADTMIYSGWTRASYCKAFAACDRRAKKARNVVPLRPGDAIRSLTPEDFEKASA